MSHDGDWREACASTTRDKPWRWLWRLVRRFAFIPPCFCVELPKPILDAQPTVLLVSVSITDPNAVDDESIVESKRALGKPPSLRGKNFDVIRARPLFDANLVWDARLEPRDQKRECDRNHEQLQ